MMKFNRVNDEGKYYSTSAVMMDYYFWEIHKGSYVGRARFGEEHFTAKGREYLKYFKAKNANTLSTPGIPDIVALQPDTLFVVEGYFDFFPFPEGTCVPIAAKYVNRDDMREITSRGIDIRKVIYIPDSDVEPEAKWRNRKRLADIFYYADVEVFEVKDLFPAFDGKDMGDLFAGNDVKKEDIIATLYEKVKT